MISPGRSATSVATRFSGLRWPLLAALAAAFLGGSDLLRRHLWTPVELWPDVVCQAYVGWRIAAGESLYLSVWESHPPLAVLYSSLPFLVAAPSIQVAHALVFSLAILFGVAQATMLYARGVRSLPAIAAIATLAAGAYSSLFANARSEDFVIILGTGAIASALRYCNGGRLAWAAVAGVLAALAIFAKPAAIVAAMIAGALVMLRNPLSRGTLTFLASGAAVGAAFAIYFLVGDRYVEFVDQVVRYGRAYFRPLSAQVLNEGLSKAFQAPTTWLLAIFAGCAILATRRPGDGWAKPVVLAAWPAFELVLALLQTTYFPYVFFPFQASLLSLTIVVVATHLVGGAATVPAFPATLRLTRALSCIVLLAIGAYALAHKAAEHRVAANAEHNTQLIAFAGLLRQHNASFDGKMLWLDAGPGIGYLAAARQVIPEYVSPPLFNPGYTSEARWSRARRGLAEVDLLTVWTEWFDLDRNAGPLEAFPSYRGFREDVNQSFENVGQFVVYRNRGPVAVYIRKGKLPALRGELKAAIARSEPGS